MTTISIYQPRFLPQLHYFHRMYQSDIFVFLDNAQFKRPSWQNRTNIWLNGKKHRITVPVKHKGKKLLINEVELSNGLKWPVAMLETIRHAYGSECCFESFERMFRNVISTSTLLLEILYFFIESKSS